MFDIADVTPEDFTTKVLESTKPVLVDIWAPWCGPCKAMMPIVKSLATEFADEVDILKLNGGENAEFMASLEVRSVPTFMLYIGGKRVAVRAGMFNIDQMRSFLRDALNDSGNQSRAA